MGTAFAECLLLAVTRGPYLWEYLTPEVRGGTRGGWHVAVRGSGRNAECERLGHRARGKPRRALAAVSGAVVR